MLEHDVMWAALIAAQTFGFYLLSLSRERGHKAVLRQMEVNCETLDLIVRVAEMQDASAGEAVGRDAEGGLVHEHATGEAGDARP